MSLLGDHCPTLTEVHGAPQNKPMPDAKVSDKMLRWTEILPGYVFLSLGIGPEN